MAESKYEKYVLRDSYKRVFDLESFSAHDDELQCGFIMVYQPFDKPFRLPPEKHRHEFTQIICFLGSNPLDVREFDADIELSMGEEGEVIHINSPTVITVPPGMYHCPLDFKRVGKPVIFMEMGLTGKYQKKHADGSVAVSYDQEIGSKKT